MRSSPTNPPTNKIPSNINEENLIGAVAKSGYPLQGVAAEKLILAGFKVTEEWGFIDGDTKEHRSLDLFARQNLGDSLGVVRPSVSLLLECKRTIHPYVFFKSVSNPPTRSFPVVRGVSAQINQVGGKSFFLSAPNALLLNLEELPFIQTPPRCAAFSKANPSGEKVTLSGEEPFNKIVLPLIKALKYAESLDKRRRSEPFYPTVLICICVLDAPMLLVESPSTAFDPILVPWVRILRLQADADPEIPDRFFGIDLVHLDALQLFLSQDLARFTGEFARRTIALEQVWKNGGTVVDLQNMRWNEVVPNKPKTR